MTVVVIKNELFCSRGPARAIQTWRRCLSMHGRTFLHLLWLLSHVQNLLKLIIYAFKYVVSTSKSILEYCNIHTVYMSAGSLHKYLLLCRKKWVGVYWKMLYLCMRLLCDIWYRSYNLQTNDDYCNKNPCFENIPFFCLPSSPPSP